MRSILVMMVAALMVIGWPQAGHAVGTYVIKPGGTIPLPACAPGGSATAATVPAGNYILTVTTADTNVCFATTCGTGGATLAVGSQIPIKLGKETQVSCRSAGGGVGELIPADPVKA